MCAVEFESQIWKCWKCSLSFVIKLVEQNVITHVQCPSTSGPIIRHRVHLFKDTFTKEHLKVECKKGVFVRKIA